MWAWSSQTVTLEESVKDWPLRDVGINLRSFFCSGLILSARSSDARHRSKPFTSPANTYTHATHNTLDTQHTTRKTQHTTCNMRYTKHTNLLQNVHTTKCQWAYTSAYERDNVATAGFDQDVLAAKAFVSWMTSFSWRRPSPQNVHTSKCWSSHHK